MAYDFSNTTQSGFHLSEDERMMLTKLKATDPVTKNEIKRLQILRETKLIETTDLDDLFQRYTNTIHRLFKVPIVAITLVDLDRVYIKARVGVDGVMQAPRRGSFCNRVLMEDTPAVCATSDATRDSRFVQCLLNWPESFSVSSDSPGARTTVHAKTVPGKSIHFYASVALVVDGVRVGSLCMFDSAPRPNLVEKALRVLPDFGAIISESMNQRHKLLLGYGSELAELSLSVVYNLKYPIENLQKSFTSLGTFVAFQPSKRVTKVLSYEDITSAAVAVGAEATRGMSAIQEEGSNCSSSNSYSAITIHNKTTNNNNTHAVQSSPLSQTSGASRDAFSPESDDSRSVNDASVSRTPPGAELPAERVPIHYKKIVNFDLLLPEKETLVDQMLEVRQRTRALITILAHSLSVAHDLQAQYHRQQDSAVSTSYTVNNAYTSIAGKRPTDEASKERIHAAGKLNSRLKRIQSNIGQSPLSSQEITYQIDPMLSGTSADPDPVKFQLSGKTLSLVMYSTLFHLCSVLQSKMDVHIRFEERDVTPLHVQLANRVGSPNCNRKYIHGGMHRLLSPRSCKSSAKSTIESGKVTRLPSFALTNTNFAITLSGSSDGSISDAQQREILLLHSRRSSLEEGTINSSELHTLQLLSQTNNNNTNNTSASASTHKQGAGTRSSVAVNSSFNTPSDKLYPLHNANLNHSVFTSPSAPTRKNSHGKHSQISGDIYITFKCPLPRASLANSSGSVASPTSIPEQTAFSPGARVKTSIFENVILRNILSMSQGGFCSTTGSAYFPDPPNPVLSSLAVFANGGTRTSCMTENNSLKMPRCEAISEVREDVSEGEYYILTVRIPCNAYTTSSSGSLGSPLTGSMDALVNADGGVKETAINKKVHALTPIQSLRNFSSSASTAALSTGSESNQNSIRYLAYDNSSSSIEGHSPKPAVPVLFGVQQQQVQTNSDHSAAEKHTTPKNKPGFNLFSPRSVMAEEAHPDETVDLPLRHKNQDYNSGAFEARGVTRKPKKSPSSTGLGKSVSLLVQSVAHSLFGRHGVVPGAYVPSIGASVDGTPSTSARGKKMRSVDVRVVPSPQPQPQPQHA